MTDGAGDCSVVVTVPVETVTPLYVDVETITDLPEITLRQISHFFEHYKDLDSGAPNTVGGWVGLEAARQKTLDCVTRYEESK